MIHKPWVWGLIPQKWNSWLRHYFWKASLLKSCSYQVNESMMYLRTETHLMQTVKKIVLSCTFNSWKKIAWKEWLNSSYERSMLRLKQWTTQAHAWPQSWIQFKSGIIIFVNNCCFKSGLTKTTQVVQKATALFHIINYLKLLVTHVTINSFIQ